MVVKSEKGWTFRDKRRREENAFETQEVMDDAVMKIWGLISRLGFEADGFLNCVDSRMAFSVVPLRMFIVLKSIA